MAIRGKVFAASVTPFTPDGEADYPALERYVTELTKRGADGVLISGTTGEGPSLSAEERVGLFQAARRALPDHTLLAGTGAASLPEAATISSAAFDVGADAIAVIPPFFYGSPSHDGMLGWFESLIRQSVPADGKVLLYSNPNVSAPVIPLEVIQRLRDLFPKQVVGIKESSSDFERVRSLLDVLPGFSVYVGSDRLLADALDSGAAGAITGLSNLFPQLLQAVYEARSESAERAAAQERLTNAHAQLDGTSRIQAIKFLLAIGKQIPQEGVRPPLAALTEDELALLRERFHLEIEVPSVVEMPNLLGQ